MKPDAHDMNMSKELLSVHGLSLGEIEDQIATAVGCLSDIHFNRHSIGGWTNVNLLGESDSKRYVVKLPGLREPHDHNPYEFQFKVYAHFSRLGLCPEPIAFGRLASKLKTPFLVLRFVEGEVVPQLARMKSSHLSMMKAAMMTFSQNPMGGFHEFESSKAYATYLLNRLTDTLNRYTSSSNSIVNEGRRLQRMTDSLDVRGLLQDDWPCDVMHGDFQEANVVFTESKAVLLDFEETCIGNSLFDIAYLLVQNPLHNLMDRIPSVLSNGKERRIRELFPLALLSVISWTIRRIVHAQSGAIEESLADTHAVKDLEVYLRSKIRDFETLVP